MTNDPINAAALLVTYFPDQGFLARLGALMKEVSRVVIVDNGSPAADTCSYAAMAGVTLVRNTGNVGIATALNQGMRKLCAEGFDWILTLDQDSSIHPGFMAAMAKVISRDSDPTRLALIGAHRNDAGVITSKHRWLRPKRGFPFFERVESERVSSEGVTLVITSGTLTNASAWRALGPFREDFFIDQVDFEYCLRARSGGYRIGISEQSLLSHSVGVKTQQFVAGVLLSPTHHPCVRRYYQMRNSVAMIKLYGRRHPHWLLYQLLALVEVFAGLLLLEHRKGEKLRACLLGLWDGLRGHMGPTARRI